LGRLSRGTSALGDEYADADVVVATHKNELTLCGWRAYTPVQIAVVLRVALALRVRYNFVDVVGHDDIAPGRKVDPGPAFPLESIQARILGRDAIASAAYQTTTALNIRSGPGVEHQTLPGSPLPKGTEVLVLARTGVWCLVDVLSAVAGQTDMQGWTHGRFLVDA
jgi:N-acetylmuramoyl-L-alanine amidase